MIFFDIGSTIVTGDGQPSRELAACSTMPIEPWLRRELFEVDHECPDTLARAICAHPHAVRAIWERQELQVMPGAIELLHSLDEPYAFISNSWHPFIQAVHQLFPRHLFSDKPKFLSHQMGVSKPGLNIFRRAMSAMGVEPHQCMMVGDSIANDIEPAKSLGMSTFLVDKGFDVCDIAAIVSFTSTKEC